MDSLEGWRDDDLTLPISCHFIFTFYTSAACIFGYGQENSNVVSYIISLIPRPRPQGSLNARPLPAQRLVLSG